MHRQRHTWIPWRRKKPSVAQVLAEARARDEAEHRAAMARILSQPTQRLPTVTPRPVTPPRVAPARVAPLLTPGQAARSRRRR